MNVDCDVDDDNDHGRHHDDETHDDPQCLS